MTPSRVVDEHRQVRGAASQLLASPEPPDAIIATAEQYAEGALQACGAHGLRVPDDVLLAVVNDSRVAQLSRPPITAVDLMPEQQATSAIEMLLSLVEGRPVAGPTLVPSTIHVRRSTCRE
jgi:LacI family transcriptional regulator